MSRGVCYMIVGAKYGPVLVVSLYSLRRHYSGPVALIAGDDNGAAIAEKVAQDARLGPVQVIRWSAPVGGGKGLQHCNKTHLPDLTPFRKTIFLDADTLVTGDPTDLFPAQCEVRLTQFANWKSSDGKIQRRTEPWRNLAPAEVARSQGNAYPAINTGTFGISHDSTGYLRRWRELSHEQPRFMCDEIVAQLIFVDHPHVIFDERWNCSPVHSWQRHAPPHDERVRIWHGHGWKFMRKETGRRLWWPVYKAAVEDNVAGLADWTPGGDRKLARTMAERAEQTDHEFYGVAKYGPLHFGKDSRARLAD